MAFAEHQSTSGGNVDPGFPVRAGGDGRSALRPRPAAGQVAATGDDRAGGGLSRGGGGRGDELSEGCHPKLLRALAARGGESWRLVAATGWDWASATFVGERHRVAAEMAEAEVEMFVTGIEEAEFALAGHIVADVAVVARAYGRVVIEALTVVEA